MMNILTNSLNGFAVKDMPMFIFQLLVSALLVRFVQLIWTKRFGVERTNDLIIIALGFTFMTILAKFSLPFAIMSLAVVLFMGKTEADSGSTLKFVAGMIAVGAGFNVVLTLIMTLLILLIVWFFPNKDNA